MQSSKRSSDAGREDPTVHCFLFEFYFKKCKGTKMEQVPKFLINLAPQFAGEVIVLFPLLLVVSNKFSSQIVNHPRDVELKETKRLYSAN